jgi:O-antigen/teichoic acid export membrane protein
MPLTLPERDPQDQPPLAEPEVGVAAPRSSMKGGVLRLASGTLVSQGLLVGLAPILSRLFSPEDLGRLGLFNAFLMVASAGVCLRLDTAIVSGTDDSESDDLAMLGLYVAIPLSILGGLGLAGLAWKGLLGFGAFSPWVGFPGAIAIFLVAAFTCLRFRIIREGGFGLASRLPVVQSLGRGIAQALLGWIRLGWTGLMLGELIGRGLGIRVLWQDTQMGLRRSWRSWSAHRAFALVSRHRVYPLFALPSALIDLISLSLPLPLLGKFFGPGVAGQYALVQRVLALPMSLIGSSVADVFHARLAESARQGTGLRREFWRSALLLSVTGIPIGLVLVGFGPNLFAWVFGEAWRQAGIFAALAAPWFVAQLIVSPLSRATLVLGGQKVKLAYDLCALGGTLWVYHLAGRAGTSPERVLGWLVTVNLIAYALFFLILIGLVFRGGRRSPHPHANV